MGRRHLTVRQGAFSAFFVISQARHSSSGQAAQAAVDSEPAPADTVVSQWLALRRLLHPDIERSGVRRLTSMKDWCQRLRDGKMEPAAGSERRFFDDY